MTPTFILVVFTLFFAVTARMLARRDGVFLAFYTILFIYTFFTQVIYITVPDGFVGLIPGDAPITDATFQGYQVFVFASFVGVFAVLFAGARLPVQIHTIQAPNDPGRFAFFVLLISLYDAVLLGILFYTYGTLSYENPDALKSQTIFARPFVLFGVVFLSLYATAVRVGNDAFKRRVCQILMAITAGIILVIAVRAGTRTVIASATIGVICFELLLAGKGHRLFTPRVLVSTIAIFVMLTAIATYRIEGQTTVIDLPSRVLEDAEIFLSTRLSLNGIIFGDYAGPSVMLLSSMADKIIIPSTGVSAIFFGCLPFGGFSGYQSIGFIVSRLVDPSLQDSWKGFGYYVLAEGYNIAGWYGIIYNTLVFGLALVVSRRFWNTDDRLYRAFVGAMFGMQALVIVRGQTSEIFRAWYLVMVPGMVLLWFGCGLRPVLSRVPRSRTAPRSAYRPGALTGAHPDRGFRGSASSVSASMRGQ
jgi:hypothetical protein